MAQGLLFHKGQLYVVVNGQIGSFTSGLYRLSDSNKDDQFDRIEGAEVAVDDDQVERPQPEHLQHLQAVGNDRRPEATHHQPLAEELGQRRVVGDDQDVRSLVGLAFVFAGTWGGNEGISRQ